MVPKPVCDAVAQRAKAIRGSDRQTQAKSEEDGRNGVQGEARAPHRGGLVASSPHQAAKVVEGGGTGRLTLSRGHKGCQLRFAKGGRELTLGPGSGDCETVRVRHGRIILGSRSSDGRLYLWVFSYFRKLPKRAEVKDCVGLSVLGFRSCTLDP